MLIVSCRPKFLKSNDNQDPPYRTITEALFNAIQGRMPIEVHILRPGTWNVFTSRLKKDMSNGVIYDVVHFDLHGEVLKDNRYIPNFNLIDIPFQSGPLLR